VVGVRAGAFLLAIIGAGCGYRPTPEAAQLYREGVEELQEGSDFEASQTLERAVAADPKFAIARGRLAEAYFELDLSAKGHAPAAQSDDLIDRGRAYERDDKLDEALTSYQMATRREPKNPAAWMRLAIVYGRQLQQERAGQAFQHAEQLSAHGVPYQRALVAIRIGDFDEARKLLANTREVPGLLELSVADYRAGDVDSTQAHAAKALDTARAGGIEYLAAPGLVDLGNAYLAKGDDDAAGKAFAQSLEYAQRFHMNRTQSRAQLALGDLAMRAGDLERAIGLFQGAGSPSSVARAQRQKGDYAAALATLGASSPRDSADILLLQGRLPEALAEYRAAHDSLDAAELYWRLGRYHEAERAIGDAGPSPDRMIALLGDRTRAEIALSQRDFPKARELARSLLRRRNLGIDLTVEARLILGTPEDLKYATHLAEQSDSPLLLAETRLASGDARRAQEWFAKAGNLEGEWRSWQALGQPDKAQEKLAALHKQWGDDDYRSYLARPDIAELLRRH
jgi:tetratricopeptide (TPR) repeat protein